MAHRWRTQRCGSRARRRVVPRRRRPARPPPRATTSTSRRWSSGATCWPRSVASTRRSAVRRRSTCCSIAAEAPLQPGSVGCSSTAPTTPRTTTRAGPQPCSSATSSTGKRAAPATAGRIVGIVLHSTADLDRTVRWVTRTMSRRRRNADIELVVVGARLPRSVGLPLAMLLLATYPNARLVAPVLLGPAVCTNLGIAETSGEVVVLARLTMNPPRDAFHSSGLSTSPTTAWRSQPLLVDRPGLVVSAGAVFGPGHPPRALPGRPSRTRRPGPRLPRGAPLSPVVAVRGSELVRLHGSTSGRRPSCRRSSSASGWQPTTAARRWWCHRRRWCSRPDPASPRHRVRGRRAFAAALARFAHGS